MAVFPDLSMLSEADIRNPQQLLRAINNFLVPTEDALRRGLTIRDNFAAHVRTLTVTAPDVWVDLSLARGWSAWERGRPPQVTKTADGWIEFRRLVKIPSVAPGPFAKLGSIPSGFEMSSEIREQVTASNYAFATIGSSSTELFLSAGGAANGWVSLNGIRAWAADPTPRPWATAVVFNLPESFKAKPAYVLPLHAEEESGTLVPPISCGGWTSTYDGGARTWRVSIPRVFGLAPLRTYRITLAVLAG